MLTEHLKELLASLGEDANLPGQAETVPTDEAEMKFPGADNPDGLVLKSTGYMILLLMS